MLEKKQLKRRKISQSLSAEEGTDGNKPSNKRKKQEISFKKKLAKLAVDDPDLYKFLKEEETDLFNLSSGDEEQIEEKRIDRPSVPDVPQSELPINKKNPTSKNDNDLLSKFKTSKDPTTGRLIVSSEFIDTLGAVLQNPSLHKATLSQAVDIAINAFKACVARVGGAYGTLSADGQLDYIVLDEKQFDQIIRLCFQTMAKCIYLLLGPVEKIKKGKLITKGKRSKEHFKFWHRYGPLAKRYLEAVHILLIELRSSEIIIPAIRAVTELVELYLHYPKLCKNLIKSTVRIWSQQYTGSEEARCIAFMVLCKMARIGSEFFPIIFKSCYVAYVANCKLVDEETLPSINFMQKSFIELTFLHPTIAYQYAFVYIRQFAIHLRNAMIAKRKDLVQTIYNWQFIKGLQLWAGLICDGTRRFPKVREGEPNFFAELAHPLVEIISITESLYPTAKFVPLRIHCLRMLLSIQTNCAIFVPTFSYSLELLEDLTYIDGNKPQTGKGTIKAFNIEKMLRLSNEQLNDAGVRQHLAEQLFSLAENSLEVLKINGHYYQPMMVPNGIKLRKFLKTCKNREHVRLFAQLRTRMAIEL